MILSIALLVISLIALYFGADWLVQGSSALALKAKISKLVIGLTIVAFGTSAPELVVSINATLAGQGDLAIGNIIGSNMFNIALILGLSAIIYPLQAQKQLTRIDIPAMIVASIALTGCFWDGRLSRLEGALFLTAIILYTLFSLYYSRKHGEEGAAEIEEPAKPRHWAIDLLLVLGGIATLIVASQLLVDNAVFIAKELGLSEAVIGLTIVAAGTSMPELATSVVAAFKKNSEIALGNVVGSNLFNILAIAGTSSVIRPIIAQNVNYIDLLVMLGLALLVLPLARTGLKISRIEGSILILIYISYTAWLLSNVI